MDIIDAAGRDETYGTYVDDVCFDIHHYDVLLLMMMLMMVGLGTCIISRHADQGSRINN